MSATGGGKGLLRSMFTENLGPKVVALAASIGLFVIVRGTEDAQMSVSVDVVALLPPPSTDRMLVSEIPDQIRVTLRGSRSVLNAIRREGVPPVQMDLRDASAHFYYFEQEELELPAGASIVQIAPAAIQLTWADRAEQRLSVEPILEGEVAEGYLLTGTTVDPPQVRVRGAAAEVNRLERVTTEAVDIEGLTAGRHVRRVPLRPLPEHVRYVADSISAVVTVTVEEQVGERTFEDVEVAIVGPPEFTLRPSAVDVEISGPRARLLELEQSRVVPFVDVTEVDPAAGAPPLAVQIRSLPEGMSATVDPAEVLVLPRR